MLASANIYERVLKVERQDGSVGAGTAIDVGGKAFLLTAAHLLPKNPAEPVTVTNRFRSNKAPLTPLRESTLDSTSLLHR